MAQSVFEQRRTAARRRQTRYRRTHWGLWLLPLLMVGMLALAGVTGIAAFQYYFAGLIYPGVQVAGIQIGGMTPAEAQASVEEGLTPYPGVPVFLQYGSRRWALSPDDLGVAVDGAATIAQGYAIGRDNLAQMPADTTDWQAYAAGQWQALQADLAEQWHALRYGQTIAPVIRFDEGKVAFQLQRIAHEVDLAPQEGSLTISGLDVIAKAGQAGRQVDVEATRAALLELARTGRGGSVPLTVTDRQPVVKSVDEAAERARNLLAQPLALLTTGAEAGQRFGVDRATLRQWLEITPVTQPDGSVDLKIEVDRQLIEEYLKQVAGHVNHPVQDASLDFDPKTRQTRVVTPSRAGQELDVAASVQAIQDGVFGNQREISLPVTIVQPKVDSSKIDEMGIADLVVEGSTTFTGSSAGRVKNIINAASKFNNVVIPPGELFSFDRYVGDVTAANGFVDSLIIAGDRTEVGVGGGVCQVSTTAFVAAARGGFPIVERWAHSYVVGYYGKPGLDATIYTPTVDFRFKNDTGHYLLVKTEVNTAKSQLTFRFYGTKPDRTVEISEPTVTNVTPPPKALYKEDKSLPAGTIKQVDWAVGGQDVVVVRTIRNGDGTVKEEKFVSKYQPWRARYLYGPGTELPAGALDEAG